MKSKLKVFNTQDSLSRGSPKTRKLKQTNKKKTQTIKIRRNQTKYLIRIGRFKWFVHATTRIKQQRAVLYLPITD